MANTTRWIIDTAFTSVSFTAGDLNSLASGGGALSTAAVTNSTNLDLYADASFVVTVGGTSSITGPFLASILLGIGDVAGKYYLPSLGAFIIYTIMIVVLIWRPQGLFARATSR